MGTRKTEVRTFGAFHYDVAYRKTRAEYLEMGFRILDAGLSLLEKRSEFVFAVEQVFLVREYLERFPAMAEPMRRFVREGRLVFAPGMLTMPDVNIPCGESFLRNVEIGRRWLAENLGAAPKICWMADIFGHHPQMPQMALLGGYEVYLFERGKRDGDDAVFLWEGIDGSRVLAQWEVDTYYGIAIPFAPAFLKRGPDWVSGYIERMLLEPLARNSAVKAFVVSPMGGDFRAPEERFLAAIEEFNARSRAFRIVCRSPEESFAEIAAAHAATLPVLRSDLNPLMQGCCSSRIRIKQSLRRLENLARAVETLDAMAGGETEEAGRLWERIAETAFHDTVCGSLADAAYREELDACLRAESDARSAVRRRLAVFGGGTSRAAGETAVALFNPLPYAATEVVEIPVKVLGSGASGAVVTDAEGRRYPAQIVETGPGGPARILDLMGRETGDAAVAARSVRNLVVAAAVPMPAGGVKTFTVRLGKRPGRRAARDAAVGDRFLENRFLRVELADNGTIASLRDKETSVEFADPGPSALTPSGMNNIIREPDYGDLWTYRTGPVNGSALYAEEIPDPMPVSGIVLQRRGMVRRHAADANAVALPAIAVVEDGPVRVSVEAAYADLAVVTRISLCAGEKMVRFRTSFVPAGKRYRLRVAFPTSIRGGRIRRSIPFGFVAQGEGEYPAQNWMDYSDGTAGLCLLNRGLPGNNVTGGVMMLSLFRAVAMEDVGTGGGWFEEGEEHVFEYALRPFGARDRGYDPAREGERFNRPFLAAPAGAGPARESAGFVELTEGRAEVSSVRRRGPAVEVRLWESAGKPCRAALSFPFAVGACVRTDLSGRPVGRARAEDRRVSLSLRPFEIAVLSVAPR